MRVTSAFILTLSSLALSCGGYIGPCFFVPFPEWSEGYSRRRNLYFAATLQKNLRQRKTDFCGIVLPHCWRQVVPEMFSCFLFLARASFSFPFVVPLSVIYPTFFVITGLFWFAENTVFRVGDDLLLVDCGLACIQMATFKRPLSGGTVENGPLSNGHCRMGLCRMAYFQTATVGWDCAEWPTFKRPLSGGTVENGLLSNGHCRMGLWRMASFQTATIRWDCGEWPTFKRPLSDGTVENGLLSNGHCQMGLWRMAYFQTATVRWDCGEWPTSKRPLSDETLEKWPTSKRPLSGGTVEHGLLSKGPAAWGIADAELSPYLLTIQD